MREPDRVTGSAVTLDAVKHGVLVSAVLVAAVAVSGCSDDPPRPTEDAAPSVAPPPSFDPALEPAAAVLALVPGDVTTLTVTDFDQVRLHLGLPDLGRDSEPAERAAFWQRADRERPLLSPGMLRPHEQMLEQQYGFSQVDVAWEATLLDHSDRKVGWVLVFRPGTDMAAVARAVRDEAAPMAGGEVDAAHRLVSSGTTDDGTASWAADSETTELVGLPANSTYLTTTCVAGTTGADLDQLGAWSLQFEGRLATARLGGGRSDLFTRMRLGIAARGFDAGFGFGVADPTTGRIGYQLTDPRTAAEMALRHELPFATCA